MNPLNYSIVNNGDSALTILFQNSPSIDLTQTILSLKDFIFQKLNYQAHSLIPAYQSLTLIFSNEQMIDLESVKTELETLLTQHQKNKRYLKKIINQKTIEIPVCYDEEFSPDLEAVSQYCQLSNEEIINRHTNKIYTVYMLGFLPGFLYLGGLDKQLFCPRKETPAIEIPASAVGIGGEQTGIYPVNSPGGWQIIGRTPIKLFDPKKENPFIAEPLDQIQFVAIDKKRFNQLSEQLS